MHHSNHWKPMQTIFFTHPGRLLAGCTLVIALAVVMYASSMPFYGRFNSRMQTSGQDSQSLEVLPNVGPFSFHLTEDDHSVKVKGHSSKTLDTLFLYDSLQGFSCEQNHSKSGVACSLAESNAQFETVSVKEDSQAGSTLKLTWSPAVKPFCVDGSVVTQSTLLVCVQPTDPSAVWFGGPTTFSQHWPIEPMRKHRGQISDVAKAAEGFQWDSAEIFQPYISGDYVSNSTLYGSVVERYWLSSDGLALYVSNDEPMEYRFSAELGVCLRTSSKLVLIIVKSPTLLTTHQLIMSLYIPTCSEPPSPEVIRSPIWSTWARYKTRINASVIKDFAEEILANSFPHSQLEIDDMYTPTYGDLEFDRKKFSPGSLAPVKQMGISTVTAWVTPFVNLDSDAFQEGLKQDYLVKSVASGVVSLVKWWQGIGALIDFTKPEAADWFIKRLDELKREGVDSFKFDAGEAMYCPADSGYNPAEFSHVYAATAARLGSRVEIRAPYRSQALSVFTRVMDKGSSWGWDNGLRTLIPSVLHLGLMGYPYILPDMIGGNAYPAPSMDAVEETGGEFDFNAANTLLPERELYINWLVVTAFLPSMQFSITPWQYDKEVVAIARKFLKLREEFVAPLMLKLAKSKDFPLVRPLWWVAPTDPVALRIDDEFLIGNDVLVAPIVTRGVRSRSVYVPPGKWLDVLKSGGEKEVFVEGPIMLSNVLAKLDQVPYYTRAAQTV